MCVFFDVLSMKRMRKRKPLFGGKFHFVKNEPGSVAFINVIMQSAAECTSNNADIHSKCQLIIIIKRQTVFLPL